jgi:fructose-1-phosphate kinase PfkB-like protein
LFNKQLKSFFPEWMFVLSYTYIINVSNDCSATVICAWGELGAWAQQGVDGEMLHSPAFPPDKVKDSLGAGDTFTAAMIASQTLGFKLAHGLQLACSLAGTKVGQTGLEGLTQPWNDATKEIFFTK